MTGGGQGEHGRLRDWLEFIAQTAIDMLDEMDAADFDRECDEGEVLLSREDGAR